MLIIPVRMHLARLAFLWDVSPGTFRDRLSLPGAVPSRCQGVWDARLWHVMGACVLSVADTSILDTLIHCRNAVHKSNEEMVRHARVLQEKGGANLIG